MPHPKRFRRPLLVATACAIACVCLITAWLLVQKEELSSDDAEYFPLVFEYQEVTEAQVDGKKVRHGTYRAWWTNSVTWLGVTLRYRGPRLVETNYVNGRLNGSYTAWHQNGTLLAAGEYVNGERHGEWVMYQPDGKILTRSRYDHGTVLTENPVKTR